MVTHKKARKLLKPLESVFAIDHTGEVVEAVVSEIHDGWLETDFGILDFDDHGTTWWFTLLVSKEKVYG